MKQITYLYFIEGTCFLFTVTCDERNCCPLIKKSKGVFYLKGFEFKIFNQLFVVNDYAQEYF